LTTFSELGLSPKILDALNDLGFESPTEIQESTIPILLERDVDYIGLAQTGTGKTAAFGLPLIEKIDTSNSNTQALILAPTRELGQQIAEQLHLYSKYKKGLKVLCVYGGANIQTQIKALSKGQHIIVATPGRLIDLMERKKAKIEEVRHVVLDEADEMLNMGFKEDLDYILSFTPSEKNTWLFSATMPKEIRRIVKSYMDNPEEVRINPTDEVNTNIEHQYCIVTRANKDEALTRFLDIMPEMRGVVFCRTKRDTQNLAEYLLKQGYKADALHGDLSQAQRDRVMKRFKSHELHVLIATDVAARGIDVNDLTHVVHYALPDDNAYYTHRSGRTARAGKQGISLAFINGREKSRINRLQKDLGIHFEHVQIPQVGDIAETRIQNWCVEVMNQTSKKDIPADLMDYVNLVFTNLTKEELTLKFLSREIEQMNIGAGGDLNAQESEDYGRGHRGSKGRGGSKHKNHRQGRKDRYYGSKKGKPGKRKGKGRR
jgi:ATP-dependent RNA helicase DeaD